MLKIDRIILAGFAASLFLTGCSQKAQEDTLISEDLIAPTEANYEIDVVEYEDFVRTSSDTVSIAYPQEVDLYWEKENSYLKELLVETGQEVKEGEVLAVFETDVDLVRLEELQLKIERLKTSSEIEKAQRLLAIQELKDDYAEAKEKRDLRREQGYAKENTAELDSYTTEIEKLTLERMHAEYDQFMYQTEYEISRMQKEIEKIRKEMEDNKLVAPFDGVIQLVASVEAGERIETDKLLISMGATKKMVLAAQDASGYFRYNMDVTVECGKEKDRQIYKGKVVAASNILPAEYKQRLALIQLTEEADLKELQRKARYTIEVQSLKNALLIDRKSLNDENDETFVYILNNDMVQKRYVTVGAANSEKIWILDGLSEGQTVITN